MSEGLRVIIGLVPLAAFLGSFLAFLILTNFFDLLYDAEDLPLPSKADDADDDGEDHAYQDH